MAFHSTQQPPPKNWEDFEELCLDIFRAVHSDATAQKHGRRGQAQHGVDVFGRFSDRTKSWGIQCKGKDANYGGSVSETELRDEVEKAKLFQPTLHHFTLATTAPKDAKIEAVARELTAANLAVGLFEVQVLGWEDLQGHISRYPEVIEKHYPGQGPLVARVERQIAELPSTFEALVRQAMRDEMGAWKENEVDPLDARIDVAKELILGGQPRSALKALSIVEQKAIDASARIKFRIAANQANAHHAMGDDTEAARLFKAASDLDPQNKHADLFRGLGTLLCNDDPAEAARLFRSQVERDPEDVGALQGLIIASTPDLAVVDPLSLVPEKYRINGAVLSAAARFYRERHQLPKARELAKAALAADPDDSQAALELASLILEPVVNAPAVRHGRLLTDEQASSLSEAEELLLKVWQTLDPTEKPRQLVPTAANLAAIYRITQRDDDALEVIEEALKVVPSEPHLIKQKAVQLALRGDRAGALVALSAVQEADPELKALKADLLSSEGRLDESLALFREILTLGNSRWSDIAKSEIPVLLLRAGRISEAETEAQHLIKSHPSSYAGYTALAEIFLRTERLEQAQQLAHEGLSKIDDGDVVGKVHLAELLFRLDDWEGTSDTLLPLTDGQYDTPLLRNLVSSLYNADRRSDLNRILGSLPKSVASIEFYIRIKAAYYERIGEISQAKTAFEEAIIIRPADLGLRLHWLQCCLQSDRMDQIQEFLSGPLSFPKAMSDERAHLLHWQDQFGDSARALKDAYHFRRERYNDPAAHRALISILLFGGHARGGFQPVDSVGVDTAVRLVQVGSEAQTLIIESGTNPDRSRGEFSPDSDIAARLLGAKKGDEVELQGTKVRSDRWIVEEILPKEVHAFRSSLKEFNSLFPEEQGFIRVNTDPEDMTPAIEEMTALTTARGDFVKQAAGLYQEMPLPLAAIAAICGHNVIDTWVGLALTGESILVAGGAHEERDAAIDLSETSRFFIIDPLTLYMLEDIGVADKILNSLGPFGIAQSSILLLEQLAAERKEAAGKELTLASSSSGRLSLQTYSKQATKASYDKAKRVLDLAKSQRILPAQADADPSHDMRQVGSFMHSAFLDTVICAKGTGGTLICEDLRIRQWADRYLDGKSVWIQPLLMVARNRGTLSPRDYTKSLVRLISLGHTFVSIDSNSLYEVASSGRVRKGDLALLMGRLESHTIELQSLTGVLTKYLADLWASPLRPKTKVLFTRKAAKILAKRWSKSQEIPRALTRLIMPEAARGQRRSYERAMREFYRD